MCDAGGGFARYQDVEADPAARRQGLAGTLVWHAGRYGHEVLGASTLVIVADPAEGAIRIYRACGFTDSQSQLTFERPSAGCRQPPLGSAGRAVEPLSVRNQSFLCDHRRD